MGVIDLIYENIIILYKNMPTRVKSFVSSDGLGNYTITLNSRLTKEQNIISFQHEIEHIERGDYDGIQNVDVLEHYRHAFSEKNSMQ